jgi:hypothetical protein
VEFVGAKGDGPAHREPAEYGLFNPQMVEERGKIIGKMPVGELPVSIPASPMPS